MAHKEACQLYIEQQIQEGLEQGKKPYSIGKELAAWVERLFEAHIPAKTIESRAFREKRKITSNEVSPSTPQYDKEIPEKQEKQEVMDKATTPGPGRLPKYTPAQPPSDAMYFAALAISQLERIRDDDPKRLEALEKVEKWINEHY